jgi:MFS family permease
MKVHRSEAASALRFVVLLGVVSLFADMTYEGARSVLGPYLGLLGASATIVGIVAGAGELIGYALRLMSGYLSDRTGRPWALTILGYSVNLLAVPLLALAGRWEIAAALAILERVGKGIRTPARDAMLSHATSRMGRGWGFGLHEALDQVGAVLGPLIVAFVLSTGGNYRTGFAILLGPALVALSVLIAARFLYPRPQELEMQATTLQIQGMNRLFWLYLAGVGLIAAGFADFPLIAFHFGQAKTVPEVWIPTFYAVAMGTDAVAALVFGRLYDRLGFPDAYPGDAPFSLVRSLGLSRQFLGGPFGRDGVGHRHGCAGVNYASSSSWHDRPAAARDRLRNLQHRLRARLVFGKQPYGSAI